MLAIALSTLLIKDLIAFQMELMVDWIADMIVEIEDWTCEKLPVTSPTIADSTADRIVLIAFQIESQIDWIADSVLEMILAIPDKIGDTIDTSVFQTVENTVWITVHAADQMD